MTPERRLIAALLAGLFVAFSMALYLRHEKKKIAQHFIMASALRAKKYIAAGKEIIPDLVEEIEMPVAYLPPGALPSKSDLIDAGGKPRYKTRISLLRGDMIAKPKLFQASSLIGLAWMLQPGQTALSLKLSAPAAVSGLVQPGDLVNVVSLINERARLLLAHVRVAAVGDQLWDPSGAEVQSEISKVLATDGFLVTLILTPPQALTIALAAEKGNLVLTLASPLEVEAPLGKSVYLDEFIQGRR